MIYTVTFNPALDYIVRMPSLNVGETNRAEENQIYPGGKGVNVTLMLKNLGHESRALGFAAGFTGNQLIKDLRDRGCGVDFISLERGMTRINVKIKGAEETEINGRGPEISQTAVIAFLMQLDRLADGDILVLSGSIPESLPENIYENILERQREKQVKVVVDTTGGGLLATLKYRPFLIKPNHHELGQLFQVKISGKDDVIRYGEKLREMGAVNVLVSMAGEGAVLIDGSGKIHSSRAPEGKLINSVGSGDSMVAGFLAGYMESGDYEKAFHMGIAAGSASAFSEGLANREATEKLLRETFGE